MPLSHQLKKVTFIKYAKDKRVKDMVHTWLCAQLKTFYTDGIRNLADQRNK
jgi:hypothetical protein